jgi:hypothetical protein
VKRGEIERMGRERNVQAKIEDCQFLHALGWLGLAAARWLSAVDKTIAKSTGKYSFSTSSQEARRICAERAVSCWAWEPGRRVRRVSVAQRGQAVLEQRHHHGYVDIHDI